MRFVTQPPSQFSSLERSPLPFACSLRLLSPGGRFNDHTHGAHFAASTIYQVSNFSTKHCCNALIVKIDSKTWSFCLCYNVQNGLSYSGEETQPTLCTKVAKQGLASSLLEQIKISCYTEYKAFGHSLIYNTLLSLNLQMF